MNAQSSPSPQPVPHTACGLLITSDLVFASRAAVAATRARVRVLMALSSLDAMEKARQEQPSLVLVDLSLPKIDLRTLVDQLRAALPRRATIIAFGPHVQEARLAAAAQAGCDSVLTRGQFNTQLDALLAEHLATKNGV